MVVVCILKIFKRFGSLQIHYLIVTSQKGLVKKREHFCHRDLVVIQFKRIDLDLSSPSWNLS